jgi:hypothetical protein
MFPGTIVPIRLETPGFLQLHFDDATESLASVSDERPTTTRWPRRAGCGLHKAVMSDICRRKVRSPTATFAAVCAAYSYGCANFAAHRARLQGNGGTH